MLDPTLTFQLDLLRVDAGLRKQIVQILEEMERELIAKVAAGVSDWSQARISQQITEAAAIIRTYYDQAAGVAIDTTTGVYQVAATDAARTLAVVVGAEVAAPVLPPAATMEQIARNIITQGATQSAWWQRQSGDAAWRFSTALRQGLVAVETNAQIIRRIRGELDVTRSNAAALVQTSVQTVANEARLAVFKDAPGVKALQWVATLDSLTCPVCAPRDGMRWTVDGKVQEGTTFPFRNPPLHYNCRCVLVPRTRFSDMGNPQRASTDGPVSAKITFDDFLKRKGAAFQDEVLGPGRAELYRSGKITLQDLVTRSGRTLTLDELRERYG